MDVLVESISERKQTEVAKVKCATRRQTVRELHSNQSVYMKTLLRIFPVAFVALFMTLFLTSCAAIGDVFKAGAWTGVIGVLLVIGIVIWLISKLFGGGGNR